MAPHGLFCGEVEHVAIAEIWTDGNFILDKCCEDLHDESRATSPTIRHGAAIFFAISGQRN